MAFEILLPAALGSLSIDPIARIVLGRPEFLVFRTAAAVLSALRRAWREVSRRPASLRRPARQFEKSDEICPLKRTLVT
jgi:hypothetical protein